MFWSEHKSPYIVKKLVTKGRIFGFESLYDQLECCVNWLWPNKLGDNLPGLEPNWLKGFLINYKEGCLHNRLDKCPNRLESKKFIHNWLSMLLNWLVLNHDHL